MMIRRTGLTGGYFVSFMGWKVYLDRCVDCGRPIYDWRRGDGDLRTALREYFVDVSGGHISTAAGRICTTCHYECDSEDDESVDTGIPVG